MGMQPLTDEDGNTIKGPLLTSAIKRAALVITTIVAAALVAAVIWG